MALLKRLAVLLYALFLPATSWGFCFEEAGNEFGVSPLILWGIARHESGMNSSFHRLRMSSTPRLIQSTRKPMTQNTATGTNRRTVRSIEMVLGGFSELSGTGGGLFKGNDGGGLTLQDHASITGSGITPVQAK